MIRYRSSEPVLTPELPQQRRGTVANVVFPTGIDRRDNLGSPERFSASTFTMGWPTIGLAWHALTCRMSCRRECRSRTGRKGVRRVILGIQDTCNALWHPDSLFTYRRARCDATGSQVV